MINITSTMNGSNLLIAFSGRIDSSNAADAEAKVNEQINGSAFDTLVLDFKELEYISSAGLRVILHLKKAYKNLQIINVNSEVYEIFDMTGFTSMMEIKKAYKQLDLTGCEIIGKGSNGTVYRYTDDIVVKVYHNDDALADIHRERELARTALVLGVNTAIAYDVAQIGDHYGSVFELISSNTISQQINADWANVENYLKPFSALLKSIHETDVEPGVLPSAKKQYLDYAAFLKGHIDDAHHAKLVQLIEAVPDSNKMVHGDYHTSNVYDVNGESILIDMDTLSVGNPVFEFASIYLAYRGFNEIDPTSSSKFMKIEKDHAGQIFDIAVKQYFGGLTDEELNQYTARFKALGYTRLLRRTIRRTPDETTQIEYLKNALTNAIDAVDTLAI